MVKYFCDMCGAEMPEGAGWSTGVCRELGDFKVKVIRCHKGVWNAGLLCPACTTRVVTEGAPASDDVSPNPAPPWSTTTVDPVRTCNGTYQADGDCRISVRYPDAGRYHD